ncbi:hypothetical protein FD723_41165 (plasmid) [Nostoc sp. C052]|uniref:hypothetical protein n=1 Tax=Nostoc sp. C052 TaxID=2576902 RepID=UPI0015C3FA17|nr:hypothetical protein [Nostoc sp. C052]QLE46620.1 hypothetical protein FD723_41165 [Nostoc sp. C052]
MYKTQHCQASTEMKGSPVVRSRIEIEIWGFGSHGLVVTMNLVVIMVNIYLYRGRDYGIRTRYKIPLFSVVTIKSCIKSSISKTVQH